MDKVLLEAPGAIGQGRLELLEDAVRIVRGKAIATIPLGAITAIFFEPATGLHNGCISFDADAAGEGAEAEAEQTVRFARRHQKEFDAIRLILETKTGYASRGPRPIGLPDEEVAQIETTEATADVQDGAPGEQKPVLEATGTYGQGKLQLTDSAIVVLRGRDPREIPLEDVTAVRFQPGTAFQNGGLTVVLRDGEDVVFKFVRRQQGPVEAIKCAIEERISSFAGEGAVAETPVDVPVAEPETEAYIEEASETEADVEEASSTDEVDTVADMELEPDVPMTDVEFADEDAPAMPEETLEPFVPLISVMRLAAVGARAKWMADEPDLMEDEAVADILSAVRLEIEQMHRVPEATDADLSSLLLSASAGGLAARAAASLADAMKSFGNGGRKPRGVLDFLNESILASVGRALAAAAVYQAKEPWLPDGLEDVDTGSSAAVFAGLNDIAAHVKAVSSDLHRRHPEAIEPLLIELTGNYHLLKAGTDRRRDELRSEVNGTGTECAGYVLAVADELWKSGVDSLNQARQDYVMARDRWSGRARKVIDNLDVTVQSVIGGLALTAAFDALRSGALPELSVPAGVDS